MPFVLNFSKLSLEINAPIGLIKESGTGIMKLKPIETVKTSMIMDVRCFIIRGKQNNNKDNDEINDNDDCSVSSAEDKSNGGNDRLGHHFSLPRFRRDVMVWALENIKKNPNCICQYSKLFINQNHNQHAWEEIMTTNDFHHITHEDHKKGDCRVVEDVISLSLLSEFQRFAQSTIFGFCVVVFSYQVAHYGASTQQSK